VYLIVTVLVCSDNVVVGNLHQCDLGLIPGVRNLIKIQLFIILSYEDLTAAHRRSCADDLYFHLREFHQPIKILHTSKFESFPLSESGKLRFDWL